MLSMLLMSVSTLGGLDFSFSGEDFLEMVSVRAVIHRVKERKLK